MKVILRAIPSRMEFVHEAAERAKPLHIDAIVDTDRNGAMDNFLMALTFAGMEPALHMEDDIILTSNFAQKVEKAIRERPDKVIQFFSMREKDITVGSRYEPGSNFIMGQCFYLPYGYSKAILDYYRIWPRKQEHPTGLDLLVADWLKLTKQKYWIHVPSLVEHRVGKSAIDPRRSSKRQSKTFQL